MTFTRILHRYGQTREPETPYQKAGQIWDERIGSSTAQARNWRLMAFGILVLAFGLAGDRIYHSGQSQVTPYVVEVHDDEVKAVGPAEKLYQPTDGEIARDLSTFITNVRSLPLDPVLARKNWLDAYAFVDGKAAQFLNAYAQANDPFKDIGKRSVSVDVGSVVRASDTSFQIRWTEQAFIEGTPSPPEHWTAILTTTISPPRTEAVLRKNPLGLYVTAMSWSRDLDTTPAH
jgi:type IV secretion system protein VirB5